MKVANLGMKWILGVSSFVALTASVQAAQYPAYTVHELGGGYCSIGYQKSKDAAVTGVPLSELEALRSRSTKRGQELVDGYQPEYWGQPYRTTCANAQDLARRMKNAVIPKAERTIESIACRANNKIYRVHVNGRQASMYVTTVTNDRIFLSPTESEPGGRINLKMTRETSACSVQFTHTSANLEGFNLCLGEDQKTGTLRVNHKNVVVNCNASADFQAAVAESLDSEGHPRRHKQRHAALKRKHKGHKAAKADKADINTEADISEEVDPDVPTTRATGHMAQ